MPQTCRDLSRSLEHETLCVLSNRANRKGVVLDALTVLSQVLGEPEWKIREACETLLDGGYIERLHAGVYYVDSPCECDPNVIFSFYNSSNICSPGGKADSVRPEGVPSGAATEGSQPLTRAPSSIRILRLSRSLPKNPLNGLIFSFRARCDAAGISPRQWNPSAFRFHLARWSKEGISVETIDEMIDVFITVYGDQMKSRSVAWKLFVYEKGFLLEKVGQAPAQQDEEDEALAEMRAFLTSVGK